MSLMKYREPNKVSWFGIRPAHYGTQKIDSAQAAGSSVYFWIVSAGKTGFLHTLVLSWYDENVTTLISCSIYDDLLVQQYIVSKINVTGVGGDVESITFNPPLELPSGWRLRLYSGNALAYLSGFAVGWEE